MNQTNSTKDRESAEYADIQGGNLREGKFEMDLVQAKLKEVLQQALKAQSGPEAEKPKSNGQNSKPLSTPKRKNVDLVDGRQQSARLARTKGK